MNSRTSAAMTGAPESEWSKPALRLTILDARVNRVEGAMPVLLRTSRRLGEVISFGGCSGRFPETAFSQRLEALHFLHYWRSSRGSPQSCRSTAWLLIRARSGAISPY